MTEMVTGSSQVSEAPVASQPVETPAAPVSQPAPQQSERSFNQQQVTDLINRERKEAVEKFKRSQQNQASDHAMTAQNSLPEDEIRRLAAEETHRLRNEWVREAEQTRQEQEAEKIAKDFFTKLSTGKDKYQDFDKVMGDVEFRSIPHVVQLANMVDNTQDVMYELGKNPTKIATIQQLIAISPKLAYAELQKLSQSIKDNEAAGKTKLPREPLSQIRSSNTVTDNGEWSVSAARKKYKG